MSIAVVSWRVWPISRILCIILLRWVYWKRLFCWKFISWSLMCIRHSPIHDRSRIIMHTFSCCFSVSFLLRYYCKWNVLSLIHILWPVALNIMIVAWVITIHLLIIALIPFFWIILWLIFLISLLVIIIANIIVDLVIDRLHYHPCILLVSFLSWFLSSGPLTWLVNSTSIYSFNLNVTYVSLLFWLFEKTSWSDYSTRVLWRIEKIIGHIIIKVRGRSYVRWPNTSWLILIKLV